LLRNWIGWLCVVKKKKKNLIYKKKKKKKKKKQKKTNLYEIIQMIFIENFKIIYKMILKNNVN